MAEIVAFITFVFGPFLAVIRLAIKVLRGRADTAILLGKSTKRILSEFRAADCAEQNGYPALKVIMNKQTARRVARMQARKETGFFFWPGVWALILFTVLIVYAFAFELFIRPHFSYWAWLFDFTISLLLLLSFLIMIALVPYQVDNIPDALKRFKARKERKSSRKERLMLYRSVFTKYAENYASYILIDARSEDQKRISPVVSCLSYSDDLLRKIGKLPVSTGIFVFSDFGKESYEIVHQLRERGFKDSYDLGEMKVWAPLLNRKLIELIGINHPPRELTKKKQGLHKH